MFTGDVDFIRNLYNLNLIAGVGAITRIEKIIKDIVLLCLHAKYAGDISDAPGVKNVLKSQVDTPLHHVCYGKINECTVMISQEYGKGERKVILTVFGRLEAAVNRVADDLLLQIGAIEDNVPEQVLKQQIVAAKTLVQAGLVPGWIGKLR